VTTDIKLHTDWKPWDDTPWFSRQAGSPELQLSFRLLCDAGSATGSEPFLKQKLAEVVTEFAAQWGGIVRRGPKWDAIVEVGRHPLDDLPYQFLVETLDRDAGGFCRFDSMSLPAGWAMFAVPLERQSMSGELLLLCGRQLTSKSLPAVMTVARAFGLGLSIARRQDGTHRRVQRLRDTLRVSTQFGRQLETQPLLEQIAHEATRLLDCDRASIFIWDREHKEVVGCPALGVEGNKLRIPDNVGVVGECLHGGKPIRVDDAYADERFNKQVDVQTGYRTRTLLCVPLLDASGGKIGVFEAINKNDGVFSDDDEESLTEFGRHAAVALQSAKEREQLVRRNRQLTQQVTQGVRIIGESPAIAALRGTIERLAATDLPVLILGESGTGKEVVAQSLHYQGPRTEHPFIAVNCAALTETLLESELFGHEKGAFTDAHQVRQGQFEMAEGGTLFLDEIGDMSLGGQAKLLRVLEQKVITRVGGSQPIRTNVRVVAATNAKLATLVREKKFREDLFYRLSVVTLDLPPLRDRPEDILPLAEFFLERFCTQARRRPLSLSTESRRRLQLHAWPGNIRELRNLMERVAFLCSHDRVEAEDLAFILSPEADGGSPESETRLSEATDKFQEIHIRRMIKRTKGNMSNAAELLGLHRSNLYRKMKQLGMNVSEEEA
jgi:Nif-specific regulatory protein